MNLKVSRRKTGRTYLSIVKNYRDKMTGLLIYSVALNNNSAIFTLDKHFKLINKTLGESMEIIDLRPSEK